MRMIRKILCTVTAFVLIVCCAGCLPAKNVLTLADSEVTLTVGQRKVLQAVVQPEELEEGSYLVKLQRKYRNRGQGYRYRARGR